MDKIDQIFERYKGEIGFEAVLGKYKARSTLPLCRGNVALDMGCGFGRSTAPLASRFERVVGLDASSDRIARARSENSAPNIEYVQGYIEDYEPDERFDTVVMSNVLEHLEHPLRVLRQVRKLMNVGGVAIATVPNAKSVHKRLGLHMGMVDDLYELTPRDLEGGHYRIYDAKSLRELFVEAGFTVTNLTGILLKPLSNTQMESWDPDLCDALFEVGKEIPHSEELCAILLIAGEK